MIEPKKFQNPMAMRSPKRENSSQPQCDAVWIKLIF